MCIYMYSKTYCSIFVFLVLPNPKITKYLLSIQSQNLFKCQLCDPFVPNLGLLKLKCPKATAHLAHALIRFCSCVII